MDSCPFMITVVGYKNSGKTTAIEGLVKALSIQGYRVGTFKHCHHGFELDQPGKDSWRHRKAGSAGTVLMGPEGFALMGDIPPGGDPRPLAGWLFGEADLVLAEGFHWLPLPRIEIAGSDGKVRPAHPDGKVVGRLPYRFNKADIETLCDLILVDF